MTGAVATRLRRHPWARATLATAALWVVSLLVVAIATATMSVRAPVAVDAAAGFGGWTPPATDATGLDLVRTGLVRWDALWYLAIGADGYPTTATTPRAAAFLPGYPLTIGLVGLVLGGRLVVAALLVSFAATVASVVGLQRLAHLVRRDTGDGRELGGTATLVLLTFPTAFFLLAPYAESLLLAATVWSLWHAADDRPWASAALAAVATVTRPTGALLAVPLLLGVVAGADPPGWWRDRTIRTHAVRRRVVPVLGVIAGGGALLLHGALRWGDPLAVVAAQAGWQRSLTFPLSTVVDGARLGLEALAGGATVYHLLDVAVLVLTITGITVLARHREWPLVAHGVVSVLLWLSQPFAGRPLMSTARFALAVPAVVLGLALLVRRPGARWALVPVSGVLLAWHLALYTRWGFVF